MFIVRSKDNLSCNLSDSYSFDKAFKSSLTRKFIKYGGCRLVVRRETVALKMRVRFPPSALRAPVSDRILINEVIL